MKAARKDCGHSAAWHAAYGCLVCDCTRPGSYVHAPQPDDDGAWTPPGTIGGTWTRLNQRTRLYESWPPPRPTSVHIAEDDHPATAPSPAAAGLPLEDVERVARALEDACVNHGRCSWEHLAAAAMAEMRPTAAEEAVKRVEALADKWEKEATERHDPVRNRTAALHCRRKAKALRAAIAPVPRDANGGEER